MTPEEAAIRRTILKIPQGKVASYGEVAEAAGLPNHHRQVAQVLRKFGDGLPWHRVVGSGGIIKQRGMNGLEQRTRLEFEGVRFRGSRIDWKTHHHVFATHRKRRKEHGLLSAQN